MYGLAVQAGFYGDVGRVLDSGPGVPGSRPGLSGNIFPVTLILYIAFAFH